MAETTARDGDTTGTTNLDEQMGQLLPAATSRDRDDVVALGQPQQQLLQTATAVNKDVEVINADMHTCKLPPEPYWIQHLELREHDKELLTGGNWLTDKHINAFNKLLKQQCPMQNGLYDPLLIAKMTRHSETANFVQIINLDNLHWVCAANIGCPDNTVNIYDSLPTYSVGSKSLHKQMQPCYIYMHSKEVL